MDEEEDEIRNDPDADMDDILNSAGLTPVDDDTDDDVMEDTEPAAKKSRASNGTSTPILVKAKAVAKGALTALLIEMITF